MNILQYTSGIKTFEKPVLLNMITTLEVEANSLEESLRNLQANEIKLTDTARSWVLTNSILKGVANAGHKFDDIIDQTLPAIATIKSILPQLQQDVVKVKDKVWDGSLMNARQVNLMNIIEYISFWLRFTRSMYDTLLTMNNSSVLPDKYLSKYDAKWMNGTADLYKQFTLDLYLGGRELMKRLNDIPEVALSEEGLAVMEASEGNGKMDLLKKGFGVHSLSPHYWYLVGKSKIQLARIENMREENLQFGSKIAQAVNLRNGTNDPELDRRIEVYRDRIIRNNHKIEEIEAEYA